MSNKIFFTPGPAQLFYTFENHLKKALFDDVPSISHRGKEFIKIIQHTNECLRELLEIPQRYDIFFLNSANEAWDRIIQNLVIKSSHHFVNGSFSQKFYDFALSYGMQSTVAESAPGATFPDPTIPEDAELIGITKNETSVGFTFSEKQIEAIRQANPDRLIALDVVSAVPSIPVNFENIDTAYFSVQKGFGMPPGLGIWICNERCIEKAKMKAERTSIGSYRAIPNLKKFAAKDQTPETPNMLFIYLLGKIAEDMLEVGKQKIINDTIYKSTILYQAFEEHELLTPFVASSENRSRTSLVADSSHPERFIDHFQKKQLVLGTGYGPYKQKHVRIANFPTHSKEIVEMVVDQLKEVE